MGKEETRPPLPLLPIFSTKIFQRRSLEQDRSNERQTKIVYLIIRSGLSNQIQTSEYNKRSNSTVLSTSNTSPRRHICARSSAQFSVSK